MLGPSIRRKRSSLIVAACGQGDREAEPGGLATPSINSLAATPIHLPVPDHFD